MVSQYNSMQVVKLIPSPVLEACNAQLQCPPAAHPSFLVLGTAPSKEATHLVQVFVPRTPVILQLTRAEGA